MKVWLVLYTDTGKDWVDIIQVCGSEDWAKELTLAYEESLDEDSAGQYYVEEWPISDR